MSVKDSLHKRVYVFMKKSDIYRVVNKSHSIFLHARQKESLKKSMEGQNSYVITAIVIKGVIALSPFMK